MIHLKRIYDNPSSDDGYRILIDRLWPRGISKDKAQVDLWLKDIAPSDSLRKWFGHDPAKWAEFQEKYKIELKENGDRLAELIKLVKKHPKITLLFGARDTEHNQAVVLRSVIE